MPSEIEVSHRGGEPVVDYLLPGKRALINIEHIGKTYTAFVFECQSDDSQTSIYKLEDLQAELKEEDFVQPELFCNDHTLLSSLESGQSFPITSEHHDEESEKPVLEIWVTHLGATASKSLYPIYFANAFSAEGTRLSQ